MWEFGFSVGGVHMRRSLQSGHTSCPFTFAEVAQALARTRRAGGIPAHRPRLPCGAPYWGLVCVHPGNNALWSVTAVLRERFETPEGVFPAHGTITHVPLASGAIGDPSLLFTLTSLALLVTTPRPLGVLPR